MKVSIIIPTLNEEKSIGGVLDEIRDAFKKAGYSEKDYEIILVDSSKDRTPEIGRAKGARIINEPRRGYGRAYKTGFKNAKGDIICTLDGDMTYPARDLPQIIEYLEKNNLDFITCDRLSTLKKGVMNISHRFGNRVLSFTANVLFRIKVKDSQSGMWIFRRRILELIEITDDGMPMSEEIKIEAFTHPNIKAEEITIDYRVREGEVKLNTWRDGLRNLKFLFKKWSELRKRRKRGR